MLSSEDLDEKVPLDVFTQGESFEKGMIIVQKGAFLVDKKNKKFFRPEYQLATEVVEKIGRKVTVLSKPSIYSTYAQKHVKHSLKVLPQIYLDVLFRSYQYSFHKDRFVGDLSQQVQIEQVNLMASKFIDGHDELKPQYLFAVYGEGDKKVFLGNEYGWYGWKNHPKH